MAVQPAENRPPGFKSILFDLKGRQIGRAKLLPDADGYSVVRCGVLCKDSCPVVIFHAQNLEIDAAEVNCHVKSEFLQEEIDIEVEPEVVLTTPV